MKVPLRNHGPPARTLLTSSSEISFEMKNPFPIGEVWHGDEIFQIFGREEITNSDEKDFPQGLEMMAHAQGLQRAL